MLTGAFGLPKQLALLPNGDILITDLSFKCIRVLSNGSIRTLIGPDETTANSVAAMPDGQVCYIDLKNQLVSVEPRTGAKRTLGIIPPDEWIPALAADSGGNVFAVARSNRLFRFTKDGERSIVTSALPFEQIKTPTIFDIDVGQDGTVYISGSKYFVAVTPEGNVKTIADDLHNEPSWCEVAPDGKVYVKDIPSGVRWLNPATDELMPVQISINTGVCDLLALSADELVLLPSGSDLICKYNLSSKEATPLLVNSVNSRAFATGNDAFLASPDLGASLKSDIIRIQGDGTTKNVAGLTFTHVEAADVDNENRLCLYADNRFYRLETDGSVTSIIPKFPSGWKIGGNTNIATGPGGLFYCITTDFKDSIQIWTVNQQGDVNILPIIFNRASFGDAYQVCDARIDVGSDGRLVFVVTAIGSKGQGPFYQRVYQVSADGTNMKEVANFDSGRIGGMVDIAVDHDNNIFVCVCEGTTGDGEAIFRISNNKEVVRYLGIRAGRDPDSIDVDSSGNVWLCTTIGVFRITRSN